MNGSAAYWIGTFAGLTLGSGGFVLAMRWFARYLGEKYPLEARIVARTDRHLLKVFYACAGGLGLSAVYWLIAAVLG